MSKKLFSIECNCIFIISFWLSEFCKLTDVWECWSHDTDCCELIHCNSVCQYTCPISWEHEWLDCLNNICLELDCWRVLCKELLNVVSWWWLRCDIFIGDCNIHYNIASVVRTMSCDEIYLDRKTENFSFEISCELISWDSISIHLCHFRVASNFICLCHDYFLLLIWYRVVYA